MLEIIMSNSSVFILLFSLMSVSYIYQKEDILSSIYNYLISVKGINNKVIISLLAAITGFLPIPGRILSCMTLLECVARKQKDFGTISYLSTHHYYLWSPLEKTVVISMALLSLTYLQFMSYMLIPLLLYILYFLYYIVFVFKVENIELTKVEKFEMNPLHLLSLFSLLLLIGGMFVAGYSIYWMFGLFAILNIVLFKPNIIELIKSFNMNLIFIVLLVVLFGIGLNVYFNEVKMLLEDFSTNNANILMVGLVGFVFSFIFGSSSKFTALSVISTLVFGIQYFVFFFLLDYAGYLISPMHKCTIYGKMYYDVPFWSYFKWLLGLSMLMFGYGIFYLFVLV
jgi:hypothetical protein